MTQWISIAALALAICAVVWAYVAHQTALDPANINAALNKVKPLASELETVATTIVQANEQRIREGKLTNSAAYNIALDYVRGWFPVDIGITNEQVVAAINSAILIASAATAQIEAAKAAKPVPPTSAPDKPLILGR